MSTSTFDGKGRPRAVITGAGLLIPSGNSLEAAWQALAAGRSGIGPITRFDASQHKTRIAGEVRGFALDAHFDLKEQRRNDRCMLFGMAAADQAVANAGFEVRDPHRLGVIVGSGLGGLETLERQCQLLNERGPGRLSPFFISGVIPNLVPGTISIRLGAKGPSWSPASACSSGAHAIGEALEVIRRGVCDAVVCGGSDATITPLGVGGFNAMKALSIRNDEPELACRPWDTARDGFVMSEGAGIVLLESLEAALRRDAPIVAEIVGYGATSDAHHITAPSGAGAVRCMRAALDDGALAPGDVDYINAHATSTPVGDVQEILAIKEVFGPSARDLLVSSTKSMHGHLLGATGAVETILTAKMLSEGVVLPTMNLDDPDEGCDLDLVPHQTRAQSVTVACTNSFGFGGTNATLALRRWP